MKSKKDLVPIFVFDLGVWLGASIVAFGCYRLAQVEGTVGALLLASVLFGRVAAWVIYWTIMFVAKPRRPAAPGTRAMATLEAESMPLPEDDGESSDLDRQRRGYPFMPSTTSTAEKPIAQVGSPKRAKKPQKPVGIPYKGG